VADGRLAVRAAQGTSNPLAQRRNTAEAQGKKDFLCAFAFQALKPNIH
jgi:hypothetical protein